MSDKKFGTVYFDDPENPKQGYASINGTTPFRVDSPNTLATDTIWLTNLSYNVFFMKTELWRNAFLRHENYMVVKPDDILKEWGYDPKNYVADMKCHTVSQLFTRIMKLCFKLIKSVDTKAKMETTFNGTTLREDLRKILPEAEYPRGEQAPILRTGVSYQEFTRTTSRGVKGSKMLMLRRPRLAHAIEMLQTPVPVGPFEYLSRTEMRNKIQGDKREWIKNLDVPCLSEVNIVGIDGDIANVFGFGNATDKNNRIARSWAPHPEVILMSEIADIDIKSVYMGKSYKLMSLDLHPAIVEFLSDTYTEFSWTAGVIAETLWRAAGLGEDKSRVGSIPSEERSHTSWRGLWIRASDRITMFERSMALSKMGYSVASYGYGWVLVSVTEEQIKDVITDGLSLGMFPRMSDIPNGMFKGNIPWDDDKSSLKLAQMYMTGQKKLIWNMDQLPYFDKNKRKEAMEKLRSEMQKK